MGITACIIVKNEAGYIERCLRSLSGFVDEVVVIDTGSEDETLTIARQFTDRIYQKDWTDNFSEARNFAIGQANEEWILILDADEELVMFDAVSFRDQLNSNHIDAYVVRIENLYGSIKHITDQSRFSSVRIFRNKPEYRYRGRIHEQIVYSLQDHSAAMESMNSMLILHYGYLDEIKQEKNKFRRNTELLYIELEQDKENPFHLFNMGQEYFSKQDYEQAIRYFDQSRKTASKSAPYYPRLMRNGVYGRIEIGRLDEARRYCLEALDTLPDYTDLWYLLGLIHQRLKEIPAALDCLMEALKLGEHTSYESNGGMGSYKAVYLLGELYEQNNQTDYAIECFYAGAENYPQHLSFFKKLSQILINNGRLADAVEVLKVGVGYHPELASVVSRAVGLLDK